MLLVFHYSLLYITYMFLMLGYHIHSQMLLSSCLEYNTFSHLPLYNLLYRMFTAFIIDSQGSDMLYIFLLLHSLHHNFPLHLYIISNRFMRLLLFDLITHLMLGLLYLLMLSLLLHLRLLGLLFTNNMLLPLLHLYILMLLFALRSLMLLYLLMLLLVLLYHSHLLVMLSHSLSLPLLPLLLHLLVHFLHSSSNLPTCIHYLLSHLYLLLLHIYTFILHLLRLSLFIYLTSMRMCFSQTTCYMYYLMLALALSYLMLRHYYLVLLRSFI